MIVTLPLPSRVTQYFPHVLVSLLQWFAFWSFSGLLVIPWLLCIYQVRHFSNVVLGTETMMLHENPKHQ